ncbi:hypothetical protein PPROV_000817100 [Pycnococcus provasolii]|uniref:Uncharacterized protein n=1 Tax=Pycnococcus provasolii TaxID=41880 RepID=A0A830HPM2_9CHLO|nr:hypothetical protein PPROV_000817100 [Pycnococcus provasolii]
MEGQAYYPVLNMKGELQDPSLADLKERIKRFGASNAVTRDGASQNGVGVGVPRRSEPRPPSARRIPALSSAYGVSPRTASLTVLSSFRASSDSKLSTLETPASRSFFNSAGVSGVDSAGVSTITGVPAFTHFVTTGSSDELIVPRLAPQATAALCRLCRWAFAKKHGIPWNHEKQDAVGGFASHDKVVVEDESSDADEKSER